jgi:hypothetical protein
VASLSTLTGALIQLRRERGFPFVPYAGQRVRMDPLHTTIEESAAEGYTHVVVEVATPHGPIVLRTNEC